MVIVAASILTKQGKVLLSRQYKEIPRLRIEGLLAAFPKLVNAAASAAAAAAGARSGGGGGDAAASLRQHTYVESDSVRYVYQPVERLYVVLITNKSSNIVEDLQTLRLLSKLLPEFSSCYGVVDEETVYESAFDLIFAFDEVIDWHGCRENVSIPQIKTYLEMYSHEERLAKMVKESKMNEAREEMRRKAQMIDKQKQDMAKIPPEMRRLMGLENPSSSSSSAAAPVSSGAYSSGTMQGVGPGGAVAAAGDGGGQGYFDSAADSSGAYFGGSAVGAGGAGLTLGSAQSSGQGMTASAGGRGLSLGGAKASADSWIEKMRAEGEDIDVGGMTDLSSSATAQQQQQQSAASMGGQLDRATAANVSSSSPSSEAAAAAAARSGRSPASGPFHLAVEEKLACQVGRDGGVESLEIKGDLTLRITDASLAHARLHVRPLREAARRAFQVRTHPNIDKLLWQRHNIVALKQKDRPFPTGGNPLGVLKWRLQSTDESLLPLVINCWPAESATDTTVNIEYEMADTEGGGSDDDAGDSAGVQPPTELRDATVRVPIPFVGGSAQQHMQQPRVTQCDGEFEYNARQSCVLWRLPSVIEAGTEQASGALEFTLPFATDASGFFPVGVSFTSPATYAGVAVERVERMDNKEDDEEEKEEDVPFSTHAALASERYEIV